MKKKKSFLDIAIVILSIIMILIATYFGYKNIIKMNDFENNIFILINSIIIIVLSIFLALSFIIKKNIIHLFSLIIFIFYIVLNLNIINLPTQKVLGDFTSKNINETIIWANENNIEISYDYENSDNYEYDTIMSQDIDKSTILRNVSKLYFIVSEGPDYNKEVIMNNFSGSSIDDFLEFKSKNYLNNVTVNYEYSDNITRDTIINQSVTGATTRNKDIVITVSLGNEDDLTPISLETMKNKSLFDATLYLKRNALQYEISYEYSDKVLKGNVISHSPNAGVTVDHTKDIITLIVSKGAKITVPNLLNMSKDDIVAWVLENNLKIQFIEEYNVADIGKVIKANYKEKDIISSGTTITITTSKGPLKFESYSSLTEFKNWADEYSVNYSIDYEFNDSVARGSIIKFSIQKDTIIDESTTIVVYISNGKSINVPNFVGKAKSNITSTCNNLGIKCTFYYTSYSNTTKDVATTQNVKTGTIVVSGAVINIGLSKGPAQTFNVYIQSSWYGSTADATISTMKKKLSESCPGVSFNFVKKACDTGFAGQIHPSSPTPGANFNCTQGKTYTFWIIN